MSNLVFIKRNPVITCFILIFAVSWGLVIILAGPGNMPIDAEQSEKLLPLLYTLMLAGPGLAGIVLTGIVNGKAGFKRLKSQLSRWRAGTRWYLAALLAAPVPATIILLILSRFSPGFNPAILNADDRAGFLLSGILIGLMVGLFEEIGWSGFIIPGLRLRYNIIATGIIVGLIWGAWHFILFWERESFLETLPFFILLGRLFAWLPPYRIFMVWLLDRTESLPIVILSHAGLVFSTTVLVPVTLTGKDLLTWLVTWGAVLWIAILVIAGFNREIFTGRAYAGK